MKPFYISLILMFILTSCSEDQEPVDVNLGYDYFPTELGTYKVYQVDSIYHDNILPMQEGTHDTSAYFLKEVIESEFEDAAKEPSLRIVRYKRFNETDPWKLADIWASKRTSTNAQRLEEDTRYIRLVFPVSISSTWDGNALNELNEWRHSYSNISQPSDSGKFAFSNTVRVNQRDFQSFVDDEYAYEVYASNVGLIEKYFKDLETYQDYIGDPSADNIRKGVEFHYVLIDYGKEE